VKVLLIEFAVFLYSKFIF